MKPKLMLFSHICGSSEITGAEKFLLFLMRELQPHFHCTLVVPADGILSAQARHRGIDTIVQSYPLLYSLCIPGPNTSSEFRSLRKHKAMPALLDLLHIRQPDYIAALTCVNPLPALAAKIMGIPCLWLITEAIVSNPYTGVSAALIHKHSNWILGISDTVLRPFQPLSIESKLHLVYPSWHEEDYKPESWPNLRLMKRGQLGLNEARPLIGCLSSYLIPNKGIQHFISMAISLSEKYPDAEFLLAGRPLDEDYYRHCVQLVEAAALGSRFHFVPFSADVQQIYSALDIVVVPSLVDEGFGLTAMEGMVFGKPVVSYGGGGVEEIHLQTRNAELLAVKGNINELASKISPLVADAALRERVGTDNSLAVREAFGIHSFRSRMQGWVDQAKRHTAVRTSAPRRYLDGRLLKGSESIVVFLTDKGSKRPFLSKRILKFYRQRMSKVKVLKDAMLNAIPTGAAVERTLRIRKKRKRRRKPAVTRTRKAIGQRSGSFRKFVSLNRKRTVKKASSARKSA